MGSDLTATEVVCRVTGVGMLEADRMLEEVSAQDRSRIVEAFELDDMEMFRSIMDTAAKENEKVED